MIFTTILKVTLHEVMGLNWSTLEAPIILGIRGMKV